MKRLIVCCDGTWQNLECSYPTNVVKIAQAIESTSQDGISQIVYYDTGIGTEGNTPLSKKIDRVLGGGLGKGIDKNIQDAYLFLCLNYCVGDEIYLFGFSRGSYTVRSLAGFIYKSGLLTRSNIREIPKAYQLYRNEIKPNDPSMIEFRQKYGIINQVDQQNGDRPPIKLLGCWDTVGGLGIPDLIPIIDLDKQLDKKYLFHDTKLSRIIENALHAVAIDEARKTFPPTLMEKNNNVENQTLWQKWFPGDHGCVGGGSKEQSGLSDGALKWMIESIQKLGLGLNINPNLIPTGINPDPASNYEADFGLISKITEYMGKRPREVSDNFEDLHETVKQRWQRRSDYRPDNLQKHAQKLDS